MSITIPGTTPQVLEMGGTGGGSICARGSESGDFSEIYALVYDNTSTSVPATPPAQAQMTTPDFQGGWEFLNLPGAKCDQQNRLAIWKRTASGYDVESQVFTGQCSDETDCGNAPPPPGV